MSTFRRFALVFGLAAIAAALLVPSTAVGKNIGGCPEGGSDKWELVTVESLGVPPEDQSGLASLDGNGDGWTCIKPLPPFGEGAFVFRDNTVGSA